MARYKVIVTFQGVATLEIEAGTPMEARQNVKELTIADLARANRTDILSLHVGAREIVPVSHEDGEEDESGPPKSRPSGWYRPA